MTLRAHIIQSLVISVVLFPFLGVDTVIFFVSAVLIDIDHYLDYVFICRRFSVRGMFRFHDFIAKNIKLVYGLSIFHTVEVFLILFVFGFWNYRFWIVLCGFLVHFIFDCYNLYKRNYIFSRAFSIFEYILKSKNSKAYPIPPEAFWDVKK